MALFSPDLVFPHDPGGFGLWLDGHAREHHQFVLFGLTQTAWFNIPDYDFIAWSNDDAAIREWHSAHGRTHDILHTYANTQSVNLAQVDWADDGAVQEWLAVHATDHANIRRSFGIV